MVYKCYVIVWLQLQAVVTVLLAYMDIKVYNVMTFIIIDSLIIIIIIKKMEVSFGGSLAS